MAEFPGALRRSTSQGRGSMSCSWHPGCRILVGTVITFLNFASNPAVSSVTYHSTLTLGTALISRKFSCFCRLTDYIFHSWNLASNCHLSIFISDVSRHFKTCHLNLPPYLDCLQLTSSGLWKVNHTPKMTSHEIKVKHVSSTCSIFKREQVARSTRHEHNRGFYCLIVFLN